MNIRLYFRSARANGKIPEAITAMAEINLQDESITEFIARFTTNGYAILANFNIVIPWHSVITVEYFDTNTGETIRLKG
jgi:hypothetical protein